MACDKPTGDCTNVSPCGTGCGCSGSTTPAPVLPKCQDVALTPGTFTNATVTVNAQGCISAVAQGEPEQYTPDECCGDSGGGGGGTAGTRGPKGDPGAAATIDVQQVIGTGTTWSVENIGTSSAAIFKFTAPASSSGGGGGSTSGATGIVGGLEVVSGLVKTLPATLVSSVTTKELGTHADKFVLAHSAPTSGGAVEVTLNLDDLVVSLTNSFQALHAAQQQTIDGLTQSLATLTNRVVALENSTDSPPGYGVAPGGFYNTTSAVVVFDISGPNLNISVGVLPNSSVAFPMLAPGVASSAIHFVKVNGIGVGVYDPYNAVVSP